MTASPVQIEVNGERREVAPGTTVLGLLEAMERHPRTVAVEHNREILPRDCYGETVLTEGDVLEIVGFVQGGGRGMWGRSHSRV